MEPQGQIPRSPSREAVESVTNLYNAISVKFPEGVRIFESRWAAWHKVCLETPTSARYPFPRPLDDTHIVSLLNSLYACTQTDEFEALKRLGPKIIQFVISKLARDDIHQNLSGVFLCQSFLSLRLIWLL
jgi:hypothetical protein